MKTLIELKMLKKKAQMDGDEKLERDCDLEMMRLLGASDSNGKKEELKKKAIERKRRKWKK